MKTRPIFILSIIGVTVGLIGAYISTRQKKAQPPVFNPASNPYTQGIYAQGIVESYQTNGENINLFPEVSGTVKQILVTEGQIVTQGMPLIKLDDSIQSANVEQQKSQAEAALARLEG